ncbi:hypothetical protein K402DRAFT_423826 [Aulographum hederae CBS 113979]|uniref:DNA-directed RNA polymerase III subunit RPC9 n=1 Tax=Aulographum hederae CBS 113979 TaxID=1176131 RepID=A0A6G1GR13_9PEZI|nr:hypothetical protein K402DRAFT_423826 [Aulographum hederae CBS 113979]
MKVLTEGTPLTNAEAHTFLLKKQSASQRSGREPPANVTKISLQTLEYFTLTTPATTTPSTTKALTKTLLQDFKLDLDETLAVLNHHPSRAVDLEPLVPDFAERFGDERKAELLRVLAGFWGVVNGNENGDANANGNGHVIRDVEMDGVDEVGDGGPVGGGARGR